MVAKTYKTMGGQYCVQLHAWPSELVSYAREINGEILGSFVYFNTAEDATAFILKAA